MEVLYTTQFLFMSFGLYAGRRRPCFLQRRQVQFQWKLQRVGNAHSIPDH